MALASANRFLALVRGLTAPSSASEPTTNHRGYGLVHAHVGKTAEQRVTPVGLVAESLVHPVDCPGSRELRTHGCTLGEDVGGHSRESPGGHLEGLRDVGCRNPVECIGGDVTENLGGANLAAFLDGLLDAGSEQSPERRCAPVGYSLAIRVSFQDFLAALLYVGHHGVVGRILQNLLGEFPAVVSVLGLDSRTPETALVLDLLATEVGVEELSPGGNLVAVLVGIFLELVTVRHTGELVDGQGGYLGSYELRQLLLLVHSLVLSGTEQEPGSIDHRLLVGEGLGFRRMLS